MSRGIVFNTEIEAKNWDSENNTLTGNRTEFIYNRVKLSDTTTLTKAQYAELLGIPETTQAVDTEGEVVEADNQAYLDLKDSYTLHKYALMVGDAFAEYDEDDNKSYVNGEVEITDDLKYVSEEQI